MNEDMERLAASWGLPTAVVDWAHDVLDRPKLIDRPTPTTVAQAQGRVVLELTDSTRHRWFLKIESRAAAWSAEVHAYRHWVPAVKELAPALAAANRTLRVMLVTRVPGRSADGSDPGHHRQAGAWSRRFHAARPSRPGRSGAADYGSRLDVWRREQPDVFSEADFAAIRTRLALLEIEPEVTVVPTHGDFWAPNWLVDDEGVLRVIDFGAARWAPATHDLVRLASVPWRRWPKTRSAFLEGFGRPLTEREEAAILAKRYLRGVLGVYVGHRLGIPSKVDRGWRQLRLLRDDDDELSRLAAELGSSGLT